MGGKSYWCDYCECFMKDDINVRKNHNIGTAHLIAKANYLQKFKDPEQIIAEEAIKLPCKKISNNMECSFGFFCRFSHYSPEQLQQIKLIVDKNRCKKAKETSETTNSMPWNTPKSRKILPQTMPPSLQPIEFDKINNTCFQSQWG